MYRPELANQVATSLTDFASEYDIDAIVEEIFEDYDIHAMASIDEIDSEEYWAIVDKHALPQGEADHGTLTDYTTGEEIRPATADEHARSLAAGQVGVFELDGRAVFVAGGPEEPTK